MITADLTAVEGLPDAERYSEPDMMRNAACRLWTHVDYCSGAPPTMLQLSETKKMLLVRKLLVITIMILKVLCIIIFGALSLF